MHRLLLTPGNAHPDPCNVCMHSAAASSQRIGLARAPVPRMQRVERPRQVHPPPPRRIVYDLPAAELHAAHLPSQELRQGVPYALLRLLSAPNRSSMSTHWQRLLGGLLRTASPALKHGT